MKIAVAKKNKTLRLLYMGPPLESPSAPVALQGLSGYARENGWKLPPRWSVAGFGLAVVLVRQPIGYDGCVHAALLALLLSSATGLEPQVVVVMSAAPIDSQRLADAMRTYLSEFRVEVRTAPPGNQSDLRRELAETRQAGDAVRAIAVIRVASAHRDTIDIELIDRLTDKALLATIPRPRGDEDLYRSVALKVQALMRSTLSEAPDLLAGRP
jgi:hypothetical protein